VSFFDSAFRLWREPRVRLPVVVLAFAAVTLLTALIAHPRMFAGFMAYDDEGYMLTALKGFVNHGNLYDDVFSQYGPFYYEAWGGLFSIFGIPVDHDGGRTMTMVAWVLSSLAIGAATTRMTSSLLLGLGTQALVFSALGVAANEPMHPGGIICLLVAAIVVASCFVRERPSPYAMAALGGVVAALALVKINVGFFAFAAVAFACVVSFPALSGRRWLRIAAEAAFVAIPILLMLGKFDEGWARRYAVHVAAAALAVVIVLRARESGRRATEELAWLLGGFALLAVFVCVAIVAAGTSLDGLVDGIVRQPLRQADAFTIPLQLARQLYVFDLLALAGAAAYWYASRRRQGPPGPAWIAVTSMLSIAVGLAMALSVNGKLIVADVDFAGFQFTMLAFAWVALAPVPGEERPATAFARLLLPLLAVLQALHAFPVAGSQTLWSTFLLIAVGALCIGNGARGLAAVVEDPVDRRALGALGALAALVLTLFVANTYLRQPYDNNRAAFATGIDLDLPGAESVRLGQEEVDLYRQVKRAIDRNCASLLMLPGMDSFYVWTELEPPSYTATGWPTLFDDEHQQRVIDDTASIEGLCLLRNVPLAAGWGGGTIPPGPLVSYLERGFQPLARFGEYELLRREGTAGAPS
jgi:hypothetical protein